jgi:H+/Cl- antiporter ClcA
MLKRIAHHSPYLLQLGVSALIACLIWSIGVLGLGLVTFEEHSALISITPRAYLLLAAPLFLGIMSYFLLKWSKGYKGPADLLKVLREKSSEFPGWLRAMMTWIIACIELGSSLSPKGFEGPYIAAAGGFSGWMSTKLHLDHGARRRLARCGLGVAFGVLFRSPLGGLICIFEFGEFEKKDFFKQLPVALISMLTSILLINLTNLPKPFITFLPKGVTEHDFIMLFVLGFACGIAALAYVFFIQYLKDIFGDLQKRLPLVLVPVIGAGVSSILAVFFPIIIGSNELSRILSNSPTVPLVLLGTIAAKIIATASADGSKCAGGTVGPGVSLGGLIGCLLGGLNPLFVVAGAAAVIGPIAGLSLTMFATGLTWLGFAPVGFLICIPLVISKLVCWSIELYPSASPPQKHYFLSLLFTRSL